MPSDTPRLAFLSGQLGYPASPAEVEARVRAVQASESERLLVARDSRGTAVGYIHFGQHCTLGSDPRLEIYGLVIDSDCRGQGWGSRLIAAAEAWGRERGLSACKFTSQTKREQAHRLYRRLGYEVTKTSFTFEKKLF